MTLALPTNRALLFTCGPNAQGQWKRWCGDTYKGIAPCTSDNANSSFFDWAPSHFGGIAGIDDQGARSSASKPVPNTTAPASCPSPQAARDNGIEKNNLKVAMGLSLGLGVPFLALVGLGGLALRHQSKQLAHVSATAEQELHRAKRIVNDLYAGIQEIDTQGQLSELDATEKTRTESVALMARMEGAYTGQHS